MESTPQTHASKSSVVAWTLVAALPGAAAMGGWLSAIFWGSLEAWYACEATAILVLLAAFVGRRRLKRYTTEGQELVCVVSTLLSLPAFLLILYTILIVVSAEVSSL